MAGNTIEAKLRIVADLAAAISGLRQLRKEVVNAGSALGESAAAAVSSEDKAAIEATKKAAADAAAARKQSDRDAADAARKLRQEEAAARKKADDDAKKAADEERKRKRKQAQDDEAARKSTRNESFKNVQLQQQITDIVSGLATGQNPFTVLLQQGGQLRDLFGGIGAAGQALLKVFTPMRLLLSTIGATFAYIAYQAAKGAAEEDRLNKSIAVTGNVTGTSLGQVDALAKRIATTQRAAIDEVRETVGAVIDSGKFTGTTLDSAARAVTTLRRVTGASAQEVVKDFDGMADGVVEWAQRSNRAYNFLTATQFKYLQQLQSEGRTQEAMRLVMDAMSETLEGRLAPKVGLIERLWRGAGNALAFFVDQLKSIGRETTPEDRIAKTTQRLNELIAARDLLNNGGVRVGKRKATLQAEIDQTEAELNEAKRELALQVQRDTDRRHAAEATQDDIKKGRKAFQDQLAQVDLAGAQKALAQQQAQLDAQQAAAELAHAKGITSELQFNLAVNRVEQQRLVAQEAFLEKQKAIEAARVEETPEDKIAKKAALQQIETQLIEVRSRIRVAAAQGRSLVAADALQEAREKAQQWAQVWQQAADQVRALAQQNAAQAAELVTDPAARARAQAEAGLAELRHTLAEQRRALELQISLTVDPGQKAELQKQLEDLGRVGKQALDNGLRQGTFNSVQAQLGELLEAVRLKEAAIDVQVEQGKLTTVEAEHAKFAARAESIKQLDQLLQLLAETARSPAEANQVNQARQNLLKLKDTTTEVEKTLRSSVGSEFSTMFTDIVTGSEKAGDAVRKFAANVLRSVLDLIARNLGEQLVRSLFGSKGGASGGSGGSGDGGFWAEVIKWIGSLFHTGGVIGERVGGMSRAVSPMVFAGAQVLHSGGIVGLRPNEVPVIAERGEEMLTADDPRHINNFRGGPVIGNLNVSVSLDGGTGTAEDAATAQNLARLVERKVTEGIAEQMRPGGVLTRYAR